VLSFEQTIQAQKERHEQAMIVLQDNYRLNVISMKEKEQSLTLLEESVKSEHEKLSEEEVKSKNLTEINLKITQDSKTSEKGRNKDAKRASDFERTTF